MGRAAAQEIYEETGVRVSPQEAFLLIYGDKVTFNRVGIGCLEDDRNTQACAARTEGRNEITVYTEADIVTNVTHWAIHELGHAFVHAVGSSEPIERLKKAQNNRHVPDRPAGADADSTYGFAGDINSPLMWQQSPSGAASEEFADMFVGWTYGQWETSSNGALTTPGNQRAYFMAKYMPTWIEMAVTNP